jgi:hypothetical protein
MIFTFDSTQANVPALSGSVGSLRTVLKACLVDGFGAGSVATLTVSAGIATATYAGAHPFKPGYVAQYAGASPVQLNGNKVILSTSGNSVTFAAHGVPDGAATGIITSKAAPAGWQELFAGALANVIALKPSVVEATGCVLRVDDTGTTNARVRAYEALTGISAGVGSIPLESQAAGGLWWPKSGTADAVARPWWLFADERAFYLALAPQSGDRFTLMWAGDIDSLKSGDAYAYLLTGNLSDQKAATTVPDGCCGYSHRSARGGAYIARAHTAVGQAIAAQRIGGHHNGSTADAYAGTAGYAWGSYPNGANNGLLVGALEVYALSVRGALPGLLHPLQDCGTAFSSGAVVEGTDDLAGRRLLALRVAPPSGSVTPGTVFVDMTGPWSR